MTGDNFAGADSSPDLYTWWDEYDDEAAVDFWALIDELDEITGCREWAGELTGKRQGRFKVGKTKRPAAAVALIDVGRFPPSPAHEANQACGNPRCVNPDHLRWVRTENRIYLANGR